MKKSKYILLVLMAIVMAAMTSCKDDKDDPNPLAPSIGTVNLSTQELSFPFFGGDQTFTVTGGTAFVRPLADWITFERVSGDSKSSTYKITCATNSDFKERTDSILVNLDGAFSYIPVRQNGPVTEEQIEYKFRSATEVAKDMYPGWNLGNTLEAGSASNNFTNNGGVGTETSWQSTMTTQEIIDAVKAAGFKSVRIPVAWLCGHMSGGSASSPTIDPYWMERVKEIVNYCLNDGLYVVLNDHWDGGWIEVNGFTANSSKYEAISTSGIETAASNLQALWTVLANEFKYYDEHLIFAGMNEPFQDYTLFNGMEETLTPILEKYNKAFVDAVRATGGNNANRILVVQGSGASINYSTTYMNAANLPEVAGKLMVEVHYYDPGQFCGTYNATGDNAFYFWGASNHGANHNSSYGEESYMNEQFAKLNKAYVAKGYPVILGEYAGMQRSLSAEQDKHNASVKYFYQCVNEYAVNNGIVPFAWDINDTAGLGKEAGSSTIIDRKNCKVVGTNAMEGIKAGAAAGVWPK